MPSPRSSTTLGPPRLSGHYAFSKLSVQREHEGERGVIFNMSTVPDPWRWWAGDCVQTPHHVLKTPISSTDFWWYWWRGKKINQKKPPDRCRIRGKHHQRLNLNKCWEPGDNMLVKHDLIQLEMVGFFVIKQLRPSFCDFGSNPPTNFLAKQKRLSETKRNAQKERRNLI